MLDKAAPDFTLPATGNPSFTLSSLQGQKVVLYFYPKDSTPGCTTESQNFRDLHDAFVAAGAVVLGISRDSIKSHENFCAKQALPFSLVGPANDIRDAWYSGLGRTTALGFGLLGMQS